MFFICPSIHRLCAVQLQMNYHMNEDIVIHGDQPVKNATHFRKRARPRSMPFSPCHILKTKPAHNHRTDPHSCLRIFLSTWKLCLLLFWMDSWYWNHPLHPQQRASLYSAGLPLIATEWENKTTDRVHCAMSKRHATFYVECTHQSLTSKQNGHTTFWLAESRLSPHNCSQIRISFLCGHLFPNIAVTIAVLQPFHHRTKGWHKYCWIESIHTTLSKLLIILYDHFHRRMVFMSIHPKTGRGAKVLCNESFNALAHTETESQLYDSKNVVRSC